jgi:hypothetical protein
MPDSETARPA